MTLKNVQRETEIDARRLKVAELYKNGMRQAAIAEYLNISLGTVNGDIKAQRGKWQQASQEIIADRFEQQLERYEEIYEAMRERAILSNSPRHAEIAIRALERIDKLVGTEAPQKREMAGPDGGPIEQSINLEGVTDDQLASIIASLPN